MSSADLRKVGTVSLLDLDIIAKFYGRDFLPFPFMFTQPSRFSWHHEYVEYARSVPDRFHHGDLAIFQPAAAAYAGADIRVECHVQYIPADTPSIRVVAARCDQAGFLAQQRPDGDTVDVYQLSPYLLGPAVADFAALQNPGRRSAIIIPEYAPTPNGGTPCEDVTVHRAIDDQSSATTMPNTQVTALGTVQSHWRATRRWGIDSGKKAAVWVRIRDDGDYLFTPDFSEAKPVSQPMLAESIDRLISEDVKALRQFRNG